MPTNYTHNKNIQYFQLNSETKVGLETLKSKFRNKAFKSFLI